MRTSMRRASRSSVRIASADQRDQQVADLDRLAGGQRDHPGDHADLAVAVGDAAADQLVGPELALGQRGRLVDGDAQLGAAQRLGVLAGRAAGELEDRPLGGPGAPRDRDPLPAHDELVAIGEQLGIGAFHVKRAVEAVRPADVAGEQELVTRRCRRGRGGCP